MDLRTRSSSVALALVCAALAGAACNKASPPEPEAVVKDPEASPTSTSLPAAAKSAELHSGVGGARNKKPSDDPLDGVFTLADATKNIGGSGALLATLDTSEGALRCKLLEDKAPLTVANFVGLAQGTRAWKDPTGTWVNKPAYDGTIFHRIIKGFMIQGGDARGNGSGEPGYVIPDEIWPGAAHDRAGLLCMANRGPNTNGAQFFITDEAAPHLDRSYTIFGECSPVDTVHKIANVPVDGETPRSKVTIRSVKIAREKPGPVAAGKDAGGAASGASEAK